MKNLFKLGIKPCFPVFLACNMIGAFICGAHANNIALNATVEASSEYGIHIVEKAVDGHFSGWSRWLNDPKDSNPWIKISFADPAIVQAVRVSFDASGGKPFINASYRIEGLLPGGGFEVLAVVENNTYERNLSVFEPVQVDAIRVFFTRNASAMNINRIHQIEVFDLNQDLSKVPGVAHGFPGPTYPNYHWGTPGAAESQRATETVVVDERIQLFVDDYLISGAGNLQRRMNAAEKHPSNPVLEADKPWENGAANHPAVLYIDGEFRMWYLARGLVWPHREGREVDGEPVPVEDTSFICYAISPDGVHWTKPEIGVHEFRGSNANNIVLRHEGSHFDAFSVIHRPELEYPFQMMVWQGTWPYQPELIAARGYEFGIDRPGHYAFHSKDGIHWEYMHRNPPHWQDRSNIGYDTQRGVYMGFAKGTYRGVRSRLYLESPDLVTWGSPQWALIPEWLEVPESRVDPKPLHHYGMLAFNYGAQYMGYLEAMYYTDGLKRKYLQLLSSHKPGPWHRVAAPEPFVDTGERPAWDWGMIGMPGNPPVEHDGQLYIHYAGTQYAGAGDRGKTKIGLATLARDRFAAVVPDDIQESGELTTVPLRLAGERLFVNADAKHGMVKAELLNLAGQVLPGFGREDCKGLILADALDAPIVWTSGRSLPDEPVRVRFLLTNAKLYGFRTDD